jgi:hypothetical protein
VGFAWESIVILTASIKGEGRLDKTLLGCLSMTELPSPYSYDNKRKNMEPRRLSIFVA